MFRRHLPGSTVVSFHFHIFRQVCRICHAGVEQDAIVTPVERLDSPELIDAARQAAQMAGADPRCVFCVYGHPLPDGGVQAFALVAPPG